MPIMTLARRFRSQRHRFGGPLCVLCGMLTILGTTPPAPAGEWFPVPVKETKWVRPIAKPIAGELPRPLLLVKLEERGKKLFDDPSSTSFWFFDPAESEKGMRKVFSGPENNQSLRFHTPLFGGWGLASGRLDPVNDADGGQRMFWFNLLDGTQGPPLDDPPFDERMDENGMVYLSSQPMPGSQPDLLRVVRLDPLGGNRRVLDLPFTDITWLDHLNLLGEATIKGQRRLIRLDVAKAEAMVIDAFPEGYGQNRFFGGGIQVAGPNGCEGYFAVSEFTLWYLPPGKPSRQPDAGNWHRVIKDVHVVKTFGGMPPGLPVTYVGNGRFAVARTVKDEIPVPPSVPKEDRIFGAAEAVSMLIDSRTGKVLETTAPYYYNHNPPLHIPAVWWSAELKPKPDPEKPKDVSLFRWNNDMTEVSFAEGKKERCGEDDEYEVSDDGRYLVLYPQWSRPVNAKTKVKFRILDGKTGKVHTAEIASDFHEVLASAGWQTLCSGSPDSKVLRDYGREQMTWFQERLSDR